MASNNEEETTIRIANALRRAKSPPVSGVDFKSHLLGERETNSMREDLRTVQDDAVRFHGETTFTRVAESNESTG